MHDGLSPLRRNWSAESDDRPELVRSLSETRPESVRNPSGQNTDENRTKRKGKESKEEENNPTHTPATSERRETPAESKSKILRDAIETWNSYWSETHGSGRPDSDTRIDQMLATARSAGWADDVIAESIRRSIGWNAKSWRDPAADHDLVTRSRMRATKAKADSTEVPY